MNPSVVTQKQVDDFNAPIKAAAKAIADRNKPRQLHSTELQREIGSLERQLADTVRQRDSHESHLAEVQAAIDSHTERLASLRAAGVSEKSEAVARITGSDFYSKSQDRSVHQNGILDNLKEEFERTEKRLRVLHEAAKNLSARAERELPLLREQLAKALKLERLAA